MRYIVDQNVITQSVSVRRSGISFIFHQIYVHQKDASQWAGRVLVKIQNASLVTHTRWFLGSFLIWKWVSPKSDTWLIKKYHILKIYYTLFHGLVKMGNPKVIVWKLISLPDPCASWKSLKNRWEGLIKVIFWSFGSICGITLLQKKF